MYLRSAPRRNKDGTEVRYLQLAHNVWDPATKRSKVQVVCSFGREDTANRQALQRLVASVTRFLDPEATQAAAADGLEFTESRPLGGTWALDGLWGQLGIGAVMRRLPAARRLDPPAERVLFALVANRALAPSSKLAAASWISRDVLIQGLPATTDNVCCRAMDWLLQGKDALEQELFGRVANLLDLGVDLLFFDTTSTYFELGGEDGPVPLDKHGNKTGSQEEAAGGKPAGFRAYGTPKTTATTCPRS